MSKKLSLHHLYTCRNNCCKKKWFWKSIFIFMQLSFLGKGQDNSWHLNISDQKIVCEKFCWILLRGSGEDNKKVKLYSQTDRQTEKGRHMIRIAPLTFPCRWALIEMFRYINQEFIFAIFWIEKAFTRNSKDFYFWWFYGFFFKRF